LLTENEYQAQLIKKLEFRFPGCVILKNDSSYKQGILDLTILHKNRWAGLEVKRSEDSPLQPNQQYFIDALNKLSYAAVIYPENEAEVMNALQQAFEPRQRARVPES
jgi:hypothetical protein